MKIHGTKEVYMCVCVFICNG